MSFMNLLEGQLVLLYPSQSPASRTQSMRSVGFRPGTPRTACPLNMARVSKPWRWRSQYAHSLQ